MTVSPPAVGRVAGLFSGIGGFEIGLARSGFTPTLFCESWEPAASTLKRHFVDVAVHSDVTTLASLPDVDVVTAGFPCTDLSQVGRTAGISGAESGLVEHVFRLLADASPTWLVLENVLNMLSLHRGAAIAHITRRLEQDGWNWAYRTVDSQYFGVAQRRRRVFLVASRDEDPRRVLFADDAPLTARSRSRSHPDYGFYWTEGNNGVGWGEGVVPTLKGGSKLGIASPPAVWRRHATRGSAIVKPSIAAGERLQGFRAGWTNHVVRDGHRWKLVGNAVSVPVATWLGGRLAQPADTVDAEVSYLPVFGSWPKAASNVGGDRQRWSVSERPIAIKRVSLGRVLDMYPGDALSLTATRGFATRLAASRLRERVDGFVDALDEHVLAMS